MDVYHIAALIVYCVFLLIPILANLVYGEANFNRLKMTGPYQVGHKDIFTGEQGVEVSVFYPMDRDEYEKTIKEKGRNTYMFRHGYTSRLGVARATSSWDTEDHKHPWFYKYLDAVKMDTV